MREPPGASARHDGWSSEWQSATCRPSIRDTCGFTGGSSFNSDSATGESIAEWPSCCNLAHWNAGSNNTVTIGPCQVNFQDLGTYPYFSSFIEDSNNNDVADLGGLEYNNTFDVYWWRAY